jgi:hypothetical protein
MPITSAGKKRCGGQAERPRHQLDDDGDPVGGDPGGDQRRYHQQYFGDRKPLGKRRLWIDDVVIEIVRKRIGDRQQQAIGRRQRGGEAARHPPAGDHDRQAGDFRHP